MPLTVKSNVESSRYRKEGNAFYQDKHFGDALTSYNKSLCFAEAGSQNFAMAFGNRSAVYFETKQYAECLENIILARKHGHKDLQKLKIREEKCLAAQNSHIPNESNDLWSFFKLSYASHKKVPFIVDCLEVQQTEEMGRGVFTNRELKTGDIIAMEKPLMKYLMPNDRYRFCSHCLEPNSLSLLPCVGKCTFSMFCSEACRDEADRVYHKLECSYVYNLFKNDMRALVTLSNQRFALEALDACGGSFGKLEAVTNEQRKSTKTVFDVDFANKSKAKEGLLHAMNSMNAELHLGTNEDQLRELLKLQRSHVKSICRTDKQFEILSEFAWKICRIRNNNTFPLFRRDDLEEKKENCFGTALFPFGSLFNHSCAPNVHRINVEDRMVFIVQRPIPKNGQLFISYKLEAMFEVSKKIDRKNMLLLEYNFICKCEACRKRFPAFQNLKWSDENREVLKEGGNALESFKACCAYIDRQSKGFPCLEMSSAMMKNVGNIKKLVKVQKAKKLSAFNYSESVCDQT